MDIPVRRHYYATMIFSLAFADLSVRSIHSASSSHRVSGMSRDCDSVSDGQTVVKNSNNGNLKGVANAVPFCGTAVTPHRRVWW